MDMSGFLVKLNVQGGGGERLFPEEVIFNGEKEKKS